MTADQLIAEFKDIFTAMGKRLVAEGCGRYKVGPGPVLGQADVYSYEAFQRKLGFTGSDAKWPPGPTSGRSSRSPRSDSHTVPHGVSLA
ncbi:peptidoglycan-binding protein [Streptomyces coeruleorubidus]